MKWSERRISTIASVLMIVAILLLAGTGMLLLRRATPFGLGLNTDSVYYVNGARNLLAGDGFTRSSGEGTSKPLTHFPPLFSILLAGIGLTGLDPLRGGRLVILLLYGLDAILTGLLAWRLTRQRTLAILATGLMILSPVNLRQFSWLMSEPLYLALLLAGFLCAWEYWQSRRRGWLVWIGLLSGMLYLARYAGLALLATWPLALLLFERSQAARLRACGLYLLTSLPWVVGLMLRNQLLTGSASNRTFIVHWAPLARYTDWARSLLAGFPPGGNPGALVSAQIGLACLGLVILAAGSWWLASRASSVLRGDAWDARQKLIWLMGLHLVIYIVSVVITMNFLDATALLDERMLLPVYTLSVLFLMAAIGQGWSTWRNPARRILAAGGVLALGLSIFSCVITVRELSQDGQGYIDRFRRTSETMQFVRERDIPVFYTNQPPQVYIQTGKAGYMVPSPLDSLTLQARPGYPADLSSMKANITRQDGLLIFFFEPGFEQDPWYLDLTRGLEPLYRFPDAIVWGRVE